MTYYRIISDKRIIDSIYVIYKESKYLEYNYKDSEAYKTITSWCNVNKMMSREEYDDYSKNNGVSIDGFFKNFTDYKGLIKKSIFYETENGIKYDKEQDAFVQLSDSFYDLIKNAVDIIPQLQKLLGDYDYVETRFISSDDFSENLLKEMVRRNAIVDTGFSI